MKKLKFVLLVTVAFGSVFFATTTKAEEAQMGGYSIFKGETGKEVNDATGYYDLKMTPGEVREISAVVRNSTDKEAIVKNAIYTTHTNMNGETDYSSLAETYDPSLKFKVHEMVKLDDNEKKAKLAPKSQKELKATITVPKNVTSGVMLGSWFFLKENQTSSETKKGMGVKTELAYSIPIKITIDKEITQPNLNFIDVQGGMDFYKKAYLGKVQNDQPALMTKLTFKATVRKKGSDEVLFKHEKTGRSMAPNSNYQFPVHLNEKQAEAGEYTYALEVTSEDPKWEAKTWKWEKEFTISKQDSEKMNKESLNDPKPEEKLPSWLIPVLIGLGLGIVLLIVIVVVMLKKRRSEE